MTAAELNRDRIPTLAHSHNAWCHVDGGPEA